jgi:RNA polymerase sigma-70 factor (ECF subfamily)
MNATQIAAVEVPWDERAMLARLRARDELAFELLVRRFGGRMLAVARRLLRDEEDARDAVQDALISALRGLDRFEGGAQLGTWLHRIVVNTALMRLRTRRRRPEMSIDDLLPTFEADGHHTLGADQAPFPDAQAEHSELQALVRKAVDRLPEGYREVYLMRDVDELSTEETAIALGISPNAVKIRLHRARQALITLVRQEYAARCRQSDGGQPAIALDKTR